ncbi:MAG TPA: heme exporter protein CcmB [Longimicrobiales bacterium]|nr:heme exporter protein CcmB [Longimicrobiales bacterium]
MSRRRDRPGGAPGELSRILAVAHKDVLVEARSRANFGAVVGFAALMLVLFGFALGPDPDALRAAAAGVLWLTVIFSSVLAFGRAYQLELEDGALDALLLYAGDRRSLFLGKVLGSLAFVAAVEAVVLPMAGILYGLPLLGALARLLPILALGTLGTVALGTFYAGMASRVRAREVLLPLLLFPMLAPLVIAAVRATQVALLGDVVAARVNWVGVLLAFDAIFLGAATILYGAVLED